MRFHPHHQRASPWRSNPIAISHRCLALNDNVVTPKTHKISSAQRWQWGPLERQRSASRTPRTDKVPISRQDARCARNIRHRVSCDSFLTSVTLTKQFDCDVVMWFCGSAILWFCGSVVLWLWFWGWGCDDVVLWWMWWMWWCGDVAMTWFGWIRWCGVVVMWGYGVVFSCGSIDF